MMRRGSSARSEMCTFKDTIIQMVLFGNKYDHVQYNSPDHKAIGSQSKVKYTNQNR